MEAYTHAFYRELDLTAAPSARRILPLVLDLLPVASAVDVGCGDGGWLSVLQDLGVGTVRGLDGDWIFADQLKIPADAFVRTDLTCPIRVDRRFDLALSLEVAEHLPATRAPGFVADLCALAPVVLFSAAIPGQGGLNHVNEQWPAYWSELFAAKDYAAVDCLRLAVWDDPAVAWWYKQNLLLFASAEALAAHQALAAARQASATSPPALVHPERFTAEVRRSTPGLGRWLRLAPAALRHSLRRRGSARRRRD